MSGLEEYILFVYFKSSSLLKNALFYFYDYSEILFSVSENYDDNDYYYVCFSRAKENLRILLFTPNPFEAKQELLDNGLFNEEQIEVVMNK